MECQNGVHVNTRRRHGRRHRLHQQHTRGGGQGHHAGFCSAEDARSFFYRLAQRSKVQRENATTARCDHSLLIHPVWFFFAGKLAEHRRRRASSCPSNDGRDVGIDVLVDVFSHLGDFTVAPDLRGQVLDNFCYVAYFYLGGRRIYIGVSYIFNRRQLLCRP